MSLVSEEGILLRSFPYSETSRVMRFLTPTHGLLSAMARGVRRDSSKGRGAVETFDQVSLVFAYREHRDLHTLRDLAVTRSRRRLGRDFARFAGASLVAELLLAHTLQEADAELFGAVGEAFDRLEGAAPELLPSVILASGWGVLSRAGFPPVVEGCARCGAALPGEGLLHFAPEAGGLLCPECGTGGVGPRLGPGARADLRSLVRGEAVPGLRGATSHLGMLEGFGLHHLAPARAFRSARLLHPFLESREAEGDAEDPSLDPGQPSAY